MRWEDQPALPDQPTAGPSGAPVSLTAGDGTGLAVTSLSATAVIEDPLAFTELHLVFENYSAPGVNPATRSDVDVTADFEAIREVDCDSPRDLEISPTGLEAWAEEKSSNAHQRPKVRQPTRCEGNQVEPEILEQSHVF